MKTGSPKTQKEPKKAFKLLTEFEIIGFFVVIVLQFTDFCKYSLFICSTVRFVPFF